MQQTQTYKLNLIEPSDPFLPDGLNQNTQRIEEVLKAREAVNDGKLAEMDGRVTVLEGHKIIVDHYIGNGAPIPRFVSLGYTPRIVILRNGDETVIGLAGDEDGGHIVIKEGGMDVTKSGSTSSLNSENRVYQFIAFT